MMQNYQNVDITPTPRILRVLGEIPFEPWQCIAELVDNSIDAFMDAKSHGVIFDKSEIVVTWSRDNVPSAQRTLEVRDTAMGMTIDQLRNAVRAGYSANDPVNNLGLFGMGFNIATARLGDVTEIYTTRTGDNEWIGIRIDFDVLNRTGNFQAPLLRKGKTNPNDHGTVITISKLKTGIRETLSNKETEIRTFLQKVYSPLLRESKISISVKGKYLFPQKPCIWDKSRFVVHNGQPVPAVIEIDHSFGTSFFDADKNRYLTEDEVDDLNALCSEGSPIPSNIITREKKVTGWIGIQRYANPNDFGIDLIRNGRKILMSDKTFFSYDNPWTNTRDLQYPVELGSTVGGRIVGELNVDFLLPTYQKNDFDRTDYSWKLLTDYICGSGPYLPKARKAAGFSNPPDAPVPVLCNAYRRCDPGTKCLYVPPAISKQFLAEFRNGKADYQRDDLWFKAAQEADQKSKSGKETTAVNQGEETTDDVNSYLTEDSGSSSSSTVNGAGAGPVSNQGNSDITAPAQGSAASAVTPPPPTSTKEDLLNRAVPVVSISGNYSFGTVSPFKVKAYELRTGKILADGISRPCYFENTGIECIYIYDPKNAAFTQYPMTPKGLLLQYIAERIKVRDAAIYSDLVDIYVNLVASTMSESKIDKASLQEKADSFFLLLREKLSDALSGKKQEVLACIHESSGEVEDTVSALFPNTALITAFQSRQDEGYDAINVVPYRTLIRLVDKFPNLIFDDKVLSAPYEAILLPDPMATERMRNEAKDRMLSFLKDALRIVSSTNNMGKNELSRAGISIDFLTEALV